MQTTSKLLAGSLIRGVIWHSGLEAIQELKYMIYILLTLLMLNDIFNSPRIQMDLMSTIGVQKSPEKSLLVEINSKHCQSQTRRARELKV